MRPIKPVLGHLAPPGDAQPEQIVQAATVDPDDRHFGPPNQMFQRQGLVALPLPKVRAAPAVVAQPQADRSEEHTSELQSLMRISYAVFCLKQKTKNISHVTTRSIPTHTHKT